MKRLFLDTNILLDLIDARRSGHDAALKIEALIEKENLRGIFAWHSLSIIEYVGGRKFGYPAIHKVIRGFLETFAVPQTGTADAQAAFQYLATDYEDALQISSAIAGNADFIATRDKDGFAKSPIDVVTPEELILLSKQS